MKMKFVLQSLLIWRVIKWNGLQYFYVWVVDYVLPINAQLTILDHYNDWFVTINLCIYLRNRCYWRVTI